MRTGALEAVTVAPVAVESCAGVDVVRVVTSVAATVGDAATIVVVTVKEEPVCRRRMRRRRVDVVTLIVETSTLRMDAMPAAYAAESKVDTSPETVAVWVTAGTNAKPGGTGGKLGSGGGGAKEHVSSMYSDPAPGWKSDPDVMG